MGKTAFVIGLALMLLNAVNATLAFKERTYGAMWIGILVASLIFVVLVLKHQTISR